METYYIVHIYSCSKLILSELDPNSSSSYRLEKPDKVIWLYSWLLNGLTKTSSLIESRIYVHSPVSGSRIPIWSHASEGGRGSIFAKVSAHNWASASTSGWHHTLFHGSLNQIQLGQRAYPAYTGPWIPDLVCLFWEHEIHSNDRQLLLKDYQQHIW